MIRNLKYMIIGMVTVIAFGFLTLSSQAYWASHYDLGKRTKVLVQTAEKRVNTYLDEEKVLAVGFDAYGCKGITRKVIRKRKLQKRRHVWYCKAYWFTPGVPTGQCKRAYKVSSYRRGFTLSNHSPLHCYPQVE